MAARPWIRLCVYPILLCLLICSGYLRCDAQPPPGPPTAQGLPESEISALKAIAAKLKIGSDLWNFNLEPCKQWSKKEGKASSYVNCTCNTTTNVCNIFSIMLTSWSLTGELPNEEFANLTHLTIIDLGRNYINGSIPPTWEKLPLSTIILIGNRLGGEIPKEIGGIDTLQSLSLEDNLLGGSLPESLGNLKNLRELLLSANNFTGEIPASLVKLTHLTDFRIDGNDISGKFPSFVGNWTLLKRLDMQGTSLEGPFPSTLSSLTELTVLRVSDFKGDGGFPPIRKLSRLQYLVLRNCSISGPIPEFLGSLKHLKSLFSIVHRLWWSWS